MARWSGVYVQDCQVRSKKNEELREREIAETDGVTDGTDDIIRGRRECAEGLLEQIKKWRKEMFNENDR